MTLLLCAFSFLAGGLLMPEWVRVRAGLMWDRVTGNPVARGFADQAGSSEVRKVTVKRHNFPIHPTKLFSFPAPFGLSWGLIGVVAFGLAFLALVHFFGQSQRALGASEVRADYAEAEAHAQEIINERDLEIGALAQSVAVMRADLRAISQRGHDAIAAATPSNEAPLDPGLVAAWRSALDELCVARADGSFVHSCGPSA